MNNNCNGLPCGGYSGSYLNTTNIPVDCVHPQTCNGCLDIIKSECIRYTGSNLSALGINQNDTLSAILVKLDALKTIQDTKNTNLLIAINSLNTRLNTSTGGSYAPYTL